MEGAEMPDQETLPSWRIFRNWGGSTAFLGIVKAQTNESAIRRAIEELNITDPEHQKRLVAQQRD
jgi:hypothetical protein